MRRSASMSSTSSPLVQHAEAFVFQQDVDVGEALHALAQDVIDRRLVEELLRRMPGPA